ncbi:MAG TPA: GNAT family N-acetyltransferase [Caulobacteraceae bacterium]
MTAEVIGAAASPRLRATSASGAVSVLSRAKLAQEPGWERAFADRRRDHRYYELLEDTLDQGLEHGCFVIRDARGTPSAFQPFIVLDQDLVLAVGARARRLVGMVRRVWPRFLMLRTLMVGCAAGEGHLDGHPASHAANASRLAAAIMREAGRLDAPLVVLKEFPRRYSASLQCFLDHGFARVPSMPMTRLDIDYESFDDYVRRALNSATRRKLNKKFRETAQAAPIEMSIVRDVTPIIDEIYPLYLGVYERSRLGFEKLTREYFCEIGRRMPDKAWFFIWRQRGKIVAFSLCMSEGEAFYPEYVGFDYAVAFDLHLYHVIVRDMISWAIAQGFKELRSSGLNYDPKLHLRHRLDPVDLYARHRSPTLNALLKRLLPLIEPTRHDPILKKFANYDELWVRS